MLNPCSIPRIHKIGDNLSDFSEVILGHYLKEK